MEEQTSGIDAALLVKLKALARRGAALLRAPCGGGLLVQRDERSGRAARQPLPMSASDVEAALGKGWLAARGASEYVLSKSGAGMLRAVLSRPAGSRDTLRNEMAGDKAREIEPSCAGPRRGLGMRQVRKLAQAARPSHSVHESPLAWLRQRSDKTGKEMISAAEFDAGERLRADFELAQMLPRVTASWDLATPAMRRRRTGLDVALQTSEAAVAARQRVEAALKTVGPEMSGVLIDVCCFLKGIEQAERNGGWPRRAGKVVLQLALAQLARHYGIGGGGGTAPGRILHWGADGYRPDIDGEAELEKAG